MKYQTVKCSERLPNEGGLFFTITNKGKHAATIYVGGDMWAIGLTDEKIEYWLEPIESDTQCMDAEEWLDKLCIEIESALNDAKMKFVIENDEGHSLSLVDFLSVDGKTIEQGKEEISNIVEQIYFHLSNTQFASQHKTQIPSEKEKALDVEGIIRKYLDRHGYDGLYSDFCGCETTDLVPCDNNPMRCKPGYMHIGKATDEHDFYIKSKPLTKK